MLFYVGLCHYHYILTVTIINQVILCVIIAIIIHTFIESIIDHVTYVELLPYHLYLSIHFITILVSTLVIHDY